MECAKTLFLSLFAFAQAENRYFAIVTKATCTHLLDQKPFTKPKYEWGTLNERKRERERYLTVGYFREECTFIVVVFIKNFLHSFGNLSKWIVAKELHKVQTQLLSCESAAKEFCNGFSFYTLFMVVVDFAKHCKTKSMKLQFKGILSLLLQFNWIYSIKKLVISKKETDLLFATNVASFSLFSLQRIHIRTDYYVFFRFDSA